LLYRFNPNNPKSILQRPQQQLPPAAAAAAAATAAAAGSCLNSQAWAAVPTNGII